MPGNPDRLLEKGTPIKRECNKEAETRLFSGSWLRLFRGGLGRFLDRSCERSFFSLRFFAVQIEFAAAAFGDSAKLLTHGSV